VNIFFHVHVLLWRVLVDLGVIMRQGGRWSGIS